MGGGGGDRESWFFEWVDSSKKGGIFYIYTSLCASNS